MDISRYNKLKREVEEAQKAHDKAEGAIEELLKQLKYQFNCETIKEAIVLQKKLKIKKQKAEMEYEKELNQFEEEWNARLEND